MRAPAPAALVIFAACLSRSHAHDDVPAAAAHERDTVPHQLLSVLGVSLRGPLHRIIGCTQSIGPSKCLAALSVWRAEKAASAFQRGGPNDFDLLDDIRQFPWEKYTNRSQDELDGQLCEGTDNLLRYRALKLKMMSGYDMELMSNGNGTLKVDILHGQRAALSRGMKNTFYNIVPYLLLPGLLMSAVLPFVLPALKMMTVAVGMLNNMALSGAIFTLLRNNAFNDKYEKKVIYVNKGYRNEEASHRHREPYHEPHHPETVYEVQYDDNRNHDDLQGYDSIKVPNFVEHINGNEADFSVGEGTQTAALNADWVSQYYGVGNKDILMFGRKRTDSMGTKKDYHNVET